MGPIVNLRRARKARARTGKAGESAQNAARHGLPKGERLRTAAQAAKARRDLDGHALEPAPGDDEPSDA